MFKDGLGGNDDQMVEDDDMDLNLDQPSMPKGAGNGANFLKQLLSKPIYFDIEVGDFIYSHPYIHND